MSVVDDIDSAEEENAAAVAATEEEEELWRTNLEIRMEDEATDVEIRMEVMAEVV